MALAEVPPDDVDGQVEKNDRGIKGLAEYEGALMERFGWFEGSGSSMPTSGESMVMKAFRERDLVTLRTALGHSISSFDEVLKPYVVMAEDLVRNAIGGYLWEKFSEEMEFLREVEGGRNRLGVSEMGDHENEDMTVWTNRVALKVNHGQVERNCERFWETPRGQELRATIAVALEALSVFTEAQRVESVSEPAARL